MNIVNFKTLFVISFGILSIVSANVVFSHGDVTPQPVATEGLKPLGEDWFEVNPYRGDGLAAEIGSSAYGQNCARCHGLQAVSGGIAPDLRELPWGAEGDDYYVQRVRNGAIRNGVTYMPSFEGLISQEGLWAIRSYLDSLSVNKPDDFKLTEVKEEVSLTSEKVMTEAKPEMVVASVSTERTGKSIFNKTCATCHALGIANAPTLNESAKADWEKRMANGLDALVASAKKGKGAMPALGGDPTLSDEELKSSIVHMLEKVGIKY